MAESAEPLVIDVVSDVVCPWCYLGKKRLEAALEASGEKAELRWRPYQLDPTIPPEGLDRKAYMEAKFGKGDRLKQAHDHLREKGAELGLGYNFDAIKRAPNTLDAHRLIRWALEAGVQDKVVTRLFALYFEEGRDISDRDLLATVAGEAGMDAKVVREALDTGQDGDAVRQEIAQAQKIGVTGVPFFIFAGRLALPGAQDPSVMVEALKQARAATGPT
jgi:predicted DsbA family dithiol-disulfide isomerase